MANRIGPDIYLTGEEIELVRSNWWITYKIREYVTAYNQKPDLIGFFNNYVVYGPDHRINNLKQKLNCFGSITDNGNFTYKVTLYVDQPVANSRQAYRVDGNRYRMVGHTFMGLEKRSNTGETVRLVFGFYVENLSSAITTTSVAGAWGDDGGSQYDVSVTNDVSANDFFQIINQLKSVGDNTAPDYNLVFNNCTTFSYNLVGSLLNLPSGIGAISFLGTGRNPADMCEDIRARAAQYGSRFTSGNNMAAPSSTNCN